MASSICNLDEYVGQGKSSGLQYHTIPYHAIVSVDKCL